MTTDTLREKLIDDLLSGESVKRYSLVDLLDGHTADAQLEADISHASIEALLDIQARLRDRHIEIVASFVDDDAQGRTLLAERLEKLLEERDTDLNYELENQKSREGAGEHYANPIGLPCGCVFDRWTNTFRTECAQHEGLQERVA